MPSENQVWTKIVGQRWLTPSGNRHFNSSWVRFDDLPDYVGSLDAMREAETLIKGIGLPFAHEEAERWHSNLIDVCLYELPYTFIVCASALQKAIAFVLTKQKD